MILDNAIYKETLEFQPPAELLLTLKQKQCPEIVEIYAYIESKKVPDNLDRANVIVYEAEMFDIVDAVMYPFQRPSSKWPTLQLDEVAQVVLPKHFMLKMVILASRKQLL